MYVSLDDSLGEKGRQTRHLEAVEFHHDHTKGSRTKPVYTNGTVHLELRVAEKKETSKPDRGVVMFETIVCNQDSRPVITGRWTLMLKRSQQPVPQAAETFGAEPARAT